MTMVLNNPADAPNCATGAEVACVPEARFEGVEREPIRGRVRLSVIQSGNREFRLARELLASLTRDDSLWTCELEHLRLMGYGYTLEEAVRRFMDDFAVTYDGLANERDDHLTGDARRLRDAITALVLEVTFTESLTWRPVSRIRSWTGQSFIVSPLGCLG